MARQSNPSPIKEQDTHYDRVYTYRLRRHSQGSFKGLWELSRMETGKIMKDADGLVYCLDDIQGDLEADGF